MARSLGVSSSKADIDEGTISGLSSFSTASGSYVGFYGVTAVVQPSGATQATLTATWVTLCAGGGFAFRTSDQIISIIAAVQQIQTVLKTLGLWKGSA